MNFEIILTDSFELRKIFHIVLIKKEKNSLLWNCFSACEKVHEMKDKVC